MSTPERYCFNQQINRVRLGDAEELVHCQITGRTAVIANHQLLTLQTCQQFATLEEHAVRVCQTLKYDPIQGPAVLALLQKSAAEGLLLSQSETIAVARNSGGKLSPASITAVTIPTKNRPDHLKRCLESYGECFNHFERKVRFIIADQSDAQMCAENAELLSHFSDKFALEIEHIDQDAVANFCTTLATQLHLPLALLKFALANELNASTKGGCNRNMLLLQTVGELIAQIDDDTLCRIMPSPDAVSGLMLTASPLQDYWFPEASEKIELDPRLQRRDFLGQHEQLLGKSIAECLEAHGQDADVNIDGITGDLIHRLRAVGGRVVSTAMGVAGQSCRSPWQPFIFLDGPSRSKLIKSEELYRHIQRTHQIMQCVSRLSINESSHTGSMNLGLDNREALPPFMPIMRGHDIVFAKLLPKTVSGGYFGALPWMLFHEGAQREPYYGIKDAARISFPTLLTAAVGLYKPVTLARTSDEHFQGVGQLLSTLAAMPLAEFHETMRHELYQTKCRRVNGMLEALRIHNGQPRFWADDINQLVADFKHNFLDPNFVVSRSAIEMFGQEEAPKAQQQLIGKFGELLRAWPAIRRGAAELRQRGVAVGVTISPAHTGAAR